MKKPNALQIVILWLGIAVICFLCFDPPTYHYQTKYYRCFRVDYARLLPACFAIITVVVGGFLSTMGLSNDRIKKWLIKYGKPCVSFIFLFLLPSCLWFLTVDYIYMEIIGRGHSEGDVLFLLFGGVALLFIIWLVFMRFKKTPDRIVAHIMFTAALCGCALCFFDIYSRQAQSGQERALLEQNKSDVKKGMFDDLVPRKKDGFADLVKKHEGQAAYEDYIERMKKKETSPTKSVAESLGVGPEKPPRTLADHMRMKKPRTLGDLMRQEKSKKQDEKPFKSVGDIARERKKEETSTPKDD